MNSRNNFLHERMVINITCEYINKIEKFIDGTVNFCPRLGSFLNNQDYTNLFPEIIEQRVEQRVFSYFTSRINDEIINNDESKISKLLNILINCKRRYSKEFVSRFGKTIPSIAAIKLAVKFAESGTIFYQEDQITIWCDLIKFLGGKVARLEDSLKDFSGVFLTTSSNIDMVRNFKGNKLIFIGARSKCTFKEWNCVKLYKISHIDTFSIYNRIDQDMDELIDPTHISYKVAHFVLDGNIEY